MGIQELIKELNNNGYSLTAIANELEMPLSTVHDWSNKGVRNGDKILSLKALHTKSLECVDLFE